MSSIKIKKDTSLRKAILQAAITGQLISNVEGETETGKQLLDRIIEERKNKLSHGLDFANAKSGKRKSKKETALAGSNPCDIPEDKIPFEIPENWCWCRLGDLGITNTGTTPSKNNPEYFGKHIDFLSPGDIQDSKITYGNQGLSESGYKVARPTPPGTIIQVCIGGSIGKCAIVDREVTFNQQINSITVIKCSTQYVYSVLSSDYFHCIIRENSTGTATPIINKSSWEKLLIPLPPLAVQNAIVAKLEEVLPLVDAYENAVLQKEELKNALPDKVKKAILQEAIQGKLTEDWRIEMLKQVQHDGRTEETGKQLLDRIIEERKKMSHGLDFANAKSGKRKSKKETALAGSNPCDIPEDEIPFEIPESWCWCRLGEIIDLLSGRDLEPSEYNSLSKGIPYMTGASNFENEKLIINRWTDKPTTISRLGDLLITCKGTIGELAINHVGDIHIARQIMAIQNTDFISLSFLKFFLISRVDKIQRQAKSMIPGISREDMLGFLFPLPPLAEQKKIVELVEQMLPLYEKLGG